MTLLDRIEAARADQYILDRYADEIAASVAELNAMRGIPAFDDSNAGNLNSFYINAKRGVDFETGEVVDVEAERSDARDLRAYRF